MKNPLDITSWWLLLYTWWLKIVIICPDQARVITILITCPKGLSNKSAKTWQVIHGETLVDREKSVLLIRTFVSVIRVMFHMVIINHLEPKGILFASGIVFIPSIRLFMRKCDWSWEAQSWVFLQRLSTERREPTVPLGTRDLIGDLWKVFFNKKVFRWTVTYRTWTTSLHSSLLDTVSLECEGCHFWCNCSIPVSPPFWCDVVFQSHAWYCGNYIVKVTAEVIYSDSVWITFCLKVQWEKGTGRANLSPDESRRIIGSPNERSSTTSTWWAMAQI